MGGPAGTRSGTNYDAGRWARRKGMTSYFLKRFLLVIPTVLGISIISFLIIHLAPGDPALLRMGEGSEGAGNQALAKQIIEETRALYGLDRPLYVQYWRWLSRMLTFDFGRSITDHELISDKLKQRLPVSIKLGAISLLLAYLISIPVGVYSATHQHSVGERITTVVLFMLYSLPNFWIATIAIVYLGGGDFWNVFPVLGLQSQGSEDWTLWQRIQDQAWHLVLPITCMTYYTLAVLSRYMRAAMLEVVRQDFIRTARAKGLSERLVIYRHALRNSLIPVITIMADLLPRLIGGSIVIETIFTIPGIGQLSVEAIFNRDYPVIMAVFTLSALITLMGILIADFLYTVVDPRISYEKKATA